MRIAEHGNRGKRRRLLRFAGLGALTGAAAAGVLVAVDYQWASLYVLPGLVFGLAFGTLLRRLRLLRLGRAALYCAAATLANAAAVVTAMQSLDTVEAIVGAGRLALALSGSIAGAVGGGLLALAMIPPLRIAQWLRLIATGALLGMALPLLIDGREIGTFAFYLIWQAGYAAALAATLPRIEAV
ncbi:MAG TPA: hypothetical protein VFK49_07215 [Stellaceae bacterium]|nr:hypothetical protein [Stellaceae bacterium]